MKEKRFNLWYYVNKKNDMDMKQMNIFLFEWIASNREPNIIVHRFGLLKTNFVHDKLWNSVQDWTINIQKKTALLWMINIPVKLRS